MAYGTMKTIAVLGLTLVMTTGAFAAEKASGRQIEAAVSGNSVQGSMLADAYAEHYAADGTIKGNGYSGEWSVTETSMCFQYGSDAAKCWEAKIEGPAIIWYKDGKVDGSGIVVSGNPNNF